MDISELARRTGLSPSALRFYEDKGLIQSAGRHAQKRIYAAGVLDRLALIALGRAAGFSLQEIGEMLGQGDGPCIDREKLTAQAKAIDRQIRRLQAVRDGLQHAARCPETQHLCCPAFQRLMQAAGAGKIQPLTVAASQPAPAVRRVRAKIRS